MENTITMFFIDTAIIPERSSGCLVLTGPGPKGTHGNLNILGYPDIKVNRRVLREIHAEEDWACDISGGGDFNDPFDFTDGIQTQRVCYKAL